MQSKLMRRRFIRPHPRNPRCDRTPTGIEQHWYLRSDCEWTRLDFVIARDPLTVPIHAAFQRKPHSHTLHQGLDTVRERERASATAFSDLLEASDCAGAVE